MLGERKNRTELGKGGVNLKPFATEIHTGQKETKNRKTASPEGAKNKEHRGRGIQAKRRLARKGEESGS